MTEMYGCTTGFAVSAFGIDPNNAKKWACTADAAINFGLGFFPGYNALKLAGTLAGVNFNFVQNGLGYGNFITAGPSPLQTLAGAASGYQLYAQASYEAAGGSFALVRYTDLASRVGFGLKSTEGRWPGHENRRGP